ncbi:hypothetical protein ZHAS_00016318 [Anopheles sinensis]|uniref:Secreted protein n=1 Tax=Anopheles sinensis TaxID=74873 RepID=A0A084WDP1_ANOSI|nr:hypothetical protein ZHAS_00016318 [Anopheles sinensis]
MPMLLLTLLMLLLLVVVSVFGVAWECVYGAPFGMLGAESNSCRFPAVATRSVKLCCARQHTGH